MQYRSTAGQLWLRGWRSKSITGGVLLRVKEIAFIPNLVVMFSHGNSARNHDTSDTDRSNFSMSEKWKKNIIPKLCWQKFDVSRHVEEKSPFIFHACKCMHIIYSCVGDLFLCWLNHVHFITFWAFFQDATFPSSPELHCVIRQQLRPWIILAALYLNTVAGVLLELISSAHRANTRNTSWTGPGGHTATHTYTHDSLSQSP